MQLGDLGTLMKFSDAEFKYIRNQSILDYLKMDTL